MLQHRKGLNSLFFSVAHQKLVTHVVVKICDPNQNTEYVYFEKVRSIFDFWEEKKILSLEYNDTSGTQPISI